MNIEIRLEKREEIRDVEILTRKAFWRQERKEKSGIGCDEHYLAHTLRTSPEFIPELNFVAEVDGVLAGNIMYSKAHILLSDETRLDVINFGPLSVLPCFQKKGVGSALMTHSISVAKSLGYGGILFFGHPSYYPRFGFREAREFNITTYLGKNYPAFMAMELKEGYLRGISGSFHESPLYDPDPVKAREYDKLFTNE